MKYSKTKHGYEGLLIVVEGTDGAGKSTQIPIVKNALVQWKGDAYLDKLRIKTIIEREISESTLQTDRPNQELVLKYALQRLKLQSFIENNIENIILSDRSYISSLAYQGMSDNYDWINEVNRKMCIPDLIVFFKTKITIKTK